MQSIAQFWFILLMISILHQSTVNLDECDMTDWTEWSPCTATCAPLAERHRTRRCLTDTCSSGSCGSRKTLKIKRCTDDLACCEGYPKWQKWGAWTVKCGKGKNIRKRSCIRCVPNKRCDEYPHMGPPFYVDEMVNENSCPYECQRPAKWNKWLNWSKCGSDCTRSTIRTCRDARTCPDGYDCVGQITKWEPCDNNCTCLGTWLPWDSWIDCHGVCGSGSQQRSRRCQKAENCRRFCIGPRWEYRYCQLWCCRFVILNPWSPWTECSATCGYGRQYRNRTCSAKGCPFEETQCSNLGTEEDKLCKQKVKCV